MLYVAHATLKGVRVFRSREQTDDRKSRRREVIIGEDEAAAWIRDGMTVSIGGFLNSSHPMPLVRAIIRNGMKNLTWSAPPRPGSRPTS